MQEKIFCDIRLCLGCKGCEIDCALEHSKSKELIKAVSEEPLSLSRKKVETVEGKSVPVSCFHCQPASCVMACISGAMHKDEEGRTVYNEEKCVGCGMCIMVCSFGVIARQKNIVLKCDLCPDLGNKYACVEACPTGALFTGTIEEFKKKIGKAEVDE